MAGELEEVSAICLPDFLSGVSLCCSVCATAGVLAADVVVRPGAGVTRLYSKDNLPGGKGLSHVEEA